MSSNSHVCVAIPSIESGHFETRGKDSDEKKRFELADQIGGKSYILLFPDDAPVGEATEFLADVCLVNAHDSIVTQ